MVFQFKGSVRVERLDRTSRWGFRALKGFYRSLWGLGFRVTGVPRVSIGARTISLGFLEDCTDLQP